MNWPNTNEYTRYASLEDIFDPAFYDNIASILLAKISKKIGEPYNGRSYILEELTRLLGTPYYQEVPKEQRGSSRWYFGQSDRHTENIKGNMGNYFFGFSTDYLHRDFARDLVDDMLEPEDVHLTMEKALTSGAFNLHAPVEHVNGDGTAHLFMQPLLTYQADTDSFLFENNGIEVEFPKSILASIPFTFTVRQGSTKFVSGKDSKEYILNQMLNSKQRILPYCMIMRHTSCLDEMVTIAKELRHCKELTESAREQLNKVLGEEAALLFQTNKSSYRTFTDVTNSISQAFNTIFRTVCYETWDERGREIMDVTARFTDEKKCVFKVSRNEQAEK